MLRLLLENKHTVVEVAVGVGKDNIMKLLFLEEAILLKTCCYHDVCK